MAYCEYCRVEIEDSLKTCSLCGRLLHGEPKLETAQEPKHPKQDNLHGITLSNKQKWRLSWKLFTLLFSTSLIVVIAVDLFIHRRFTWSLYPIVSIAVVPVIVFSLYAHYRMRKHVDMKPFFIFDPSSSEIDSGSS